ncbi:MAG TPA: MBL fold metallo-hydrolase [Bryobacteraceae bacterium]|nr:MBL fold metallo-hydrolase [Bryobacteraceae bacterium]
MKLTFWGAARTVTGSMHELTVAGSRYLLDCGTYQGRRREARERNSHFPFPAHQVNCVMLSHAHIDHSGNLPTLVKNGYTGPIYTSPATADLCDPMLLDSANLQEKDAVFLNKRSWRRRSVLGNQAASDEVVEPVYTAPDAEQTLKQFQRVLLHTPTEVGPGVIYETIDAGHMLGSTSMILQLRESGAPIRLLFSADVGRRGLPITPDPDPAPPAEYLILESTYGDRLHQDLGRIADKLADTINRTCARGGRIIAPAFAVGRTQQLVLMLHQLINESRIPSIPIFVDSPLAAKATSVFRAHAEAHDAETQIFAQHGEDPFGFQRLRYTQDVNESKALNDLRGPFLVISSSGMCEAGRILHHLRNNIEDPRNTVLITGFQAENTLGRRIVEREREVPIFGDLFRLRAEVVKLNELSGHADQRELLEWMKPVTPGLKKVFLVHGEIGPQQALARAIQERYGLPVEIPERGQSFDLS